MRISMSMNYGQISANVLMKIVSDSRIQHTHARFTRHHNKSEPNAVSQDLSETR